MTTADPNSIHQAFADAANSGDLDRLASLFAPDAVIIERGGGRASGTDAIRRHLEQLLALNPKMQIHTTHTFAHGDIVLLCSRWTATATTPDGQQVNLDYRGTEVARRDNAGTWRLYIDNPWGADVGDAM
jgi:uncharacterized protein (TIGR02246 family)